MRFDFRKAWKSYKGIYVFKEN